jgi:hypothetical protein
MKLLLNVRPACCATGRLTRNDIESHPPVLEALSGTAGTRSALAVKNYRLWRGNPHHSSLDFKKLAGRGERFTIRVGEHYRALGHKISGGVEWVWIGTHEEYNKLVR